MNYTPRKGKSRSPLIFLFVIAATAGLGLVLFLKIGTLLAVNDPVPQRLDVIFTFGGENERVAYSRKLLQQFPDAHWLLSDYHHLFSHILQRDGFTMARVSFLDTSTNTLSEVNGLKDWISGHKDSLAQKHLSIGLVSNPLHMRRIKFMTQTVFHDTSIHIYYLPVPLDQYHWKPRDVVFWWQSKTIRNWVTSEIGKLMAFWFFS